MPAPTSQKRNWGGEWNPLTTYLLWNDCDNILHDPFFLQPLQHPTSWFQKAVSYLAGCKLVECHSHFLFFTHSQAVRMRTCPCAHKHQTQYTHGCENGGKEEVIQRGCRERREKITRWPYLASVDNASRRCKLDKEWLSWRLDVAQRWFAVNLTTFVVWPLPSRRCYYESERDESERSRGREKWRC